jgi:hypothetical protein
MSKGDSPINSEMNSAMAETEIREKEMVKIMNKISWSGILRAKSG